MCRNGRLGVYDHRRLAQVQFRVFHKFHKGFFLEREKNGLWVVEGELNGLK